MSTRQRFHANSVLLLLLAILLLISESARANKVLLIGAEGRTTTDYASSDQMIADAYDLFVNVLKYNPDDVIVALTAKGYGIDYYGDGEQNLWTVKDDEHRGIVGGTIPIDFPGTEVGVREAFFHLKGKVGKDETVTIFSQTHGSSGYWMDLYYGTMSGNAIGEYLNDIAEKAKSVLYVNVSCYSGTLVDDLDEVKGNFSEDAKITVFTIVGNIPCNLPSAHWECHLFTISGHYCPKQLFS